MNKNKYTNSKIRNLFGLLCILMVVGSHSVGSSSSSDPWVYQDRRADRLRQELTSDIKTMLQNIASKRRDSQPEGMSDKSTVGRDMKKILTLIQEGQMRSPLIKRYPNSRALLSCILADKTGDASFVFNFHETSNRSGSLQFRSIVIRKRQGINTHKTEKYPWPLLRKQGMPDMSRISSKVQELDGMQPRILNDPFMAILIGSIDVITKCLPPATTQLDRTLKNYLNELADQGRICRLTGSFDGNKIYLRDPTDPDTVCITVTRLPDCLFYYYRYHSIEFRKNDKSLTFDRSGRLIFKINGEVEQNRSAWLPMANFRIKLDLVCSAILEQVDRQLSRDEFDTQSATRVPTDRISTSDDTDSIEDVMSILPPDHGDDSNQQQSPGLFVKFSLPLGDINPLPINMNISYRKHIQNIINNWREQGIDILEGTRDGNEIHLTYPTKADTGVITVTLLSDTLTYIEFTKNGASLTFDQSDGVPKVRGVNGQLDILTDESTIDYFKSFGKLCEDLSKAQDTTVFMANRPLSLDSAHKPMPLSGSASALAVNPSSTTPYMQMIPTPGVAVSLETYDPSPELALAPETQVAHTQRSHPLRIPVPPTEQTTALPETPVARPRPASVSRISALSSRQPMSDTRRLDSAVDISSVNEGNYVSRGVPTRSSRPSTTGPADVRSPEHTGLPPASRPVFSLRSGLSNLSRLATSQDSRALPSNINGRTRVNSTQVSRSSTGVSSQARRR